MFYKGLRIDLMDESSFNENEIAYFWIYQKDIK